MNRCCRFFFVLLLFSSWLGCDEPSEIRNYRIAKSRSDLGDIGKEDPEAVAAPQRPAPVEGQMLVAIAARPDATWFFKFTGPIDAMEAVADEYEQILADIDFDAKGEPVWEVSEDWKMGPAKQFRFATLLRTIPGKGNVELSISNLAPNQNLLDNVNRWLGQLGKRPIKEDQLELGSMKYKSGDFKVFDDTGIISTGGMTPPQPPAPTSDPNLIFEVPDGWKKGPINQIVKARLLHGDEGTAPQISVTQLMAAANTWIPNAQRWARQVEMDDSEDVMKENSTRITVAGIEGDKIRLVSDDVAKERGLIGIMIVRDELAWFFKMFGTREEIIELEPDFDKFINSFNFK